MDIAPDYELLEKIKNQLMNAQDIIVTRHVFKKLKERPITEEQIKHMISNPKNLTHVELQKDERGEKYKMIFRKSGKYDIIIIIRYINNHLKIITMYHQNKKRIKIIQKWRKRKIRRR